MDKKAQKIADLLCAMLDENEMAALQLVAGSLVGIMDGSARNKGITEGDLTIENVDGWQIVLKRPPVKH